MSGIGDMAPPGYNTTINNVIEGIVQCDTMRKYGDEHITDGFFMLERPLAKG